MSKHDTNVTRETNLLNALPKDYYPTHRNAILDNEGVVAGIPATVYIGSDSYGTMVTKVTRCTITVAFTHVGRSVEVPMVFHKTRRGAWVNGSHRLTVGVAVDYRDPDF